MSTGTNHFEQTASHLDSSVTILYIVGTPGHRLRCGFDSEDACFVMLCGSPAWQEEQARRSFLWSEHAILAFGAQIDALCDQATNAPALRNARSKGGFLHERTHHNTRHPKQPTRRSGHVMGGDASGTGNRRSVLAL